MVNGKDELIFHFKMDRYSTEMEINCPEGLLDSKPEQQNPLTAKEPRSSGTITCFSAK